LGVVFDGSLPESEESSAMLISLSAMIAREFTRWCLNVARRGFMASGREAQLSAKSGCSELASWSHIPPLLANNLTPPLHLHLHQRGSFYNTMAATAHTRQ
jgi:hypothetical protein